MLLNQHIEFFDVKGVGHVDLQLSDKRMNVLIGSNGVGKTKTLESLYTLLFFTNQQISNIHSGYYDYTGQYFPYSKALVNESLAILSPPQNTWRSKPEVVELELHNFPVVFLAAQNRGTIKNGSSDSIQPLGEYKERQNKYFGTITESIKNDFSTLNTDYPIEEWFIQRAQSANAYQAKEDNREVELLTVLRLLNQIDSRISEKKEDFKILGGKTVSITIDNQHRRLNELSSGFASLIKIIQSIVAGYSFFTNTEYIEDVEGYVLIDEIESHLHIEWQTKILPLLTKIFPKTCFVITTHSSLVLTQLIQGKAYQLVRDNDKVITKPIPNAGQAALVDLLEEAFGINLNQLKIENTTAESQTEVKQALLALLRGEHVK